MGTWLMTHAVGEIFEICLKQQFLCPVATLQVLLDAVEKEWPDNTWNNFRNRPETEDRAAILRSRVDG